MNLLFWSKIYHGHLYKVNLFTVSGFKSYSTIYFSVLCRPKPLKLLKYAILNFTIRQFASARKCADVYWLSVEESSLISKLSSSSSLLGRLHLLSIFSLLSNSSTR